MTDQLNSLTLEQKVGQLFFIGIPGPAIDPATHELLAQISPGGVCLFARNIREAAATRTLLDGIRDILPALPVLSVDQEGGRVDRLRRLMTPMPAASSITNTADAGRLAAIIAETLRMLGFNMDFAPVVDVIDEERAKYTNGLTSRGFGHSKEDVAVLAGEFLQVLQSGGIAGCLKHFPGLAAARVDSHEELPEVVISAGELDSTDLFPYRRLLGDHDVKAIMAAHAVFPNHPLQEKDQNGKLLPSSLSKNFITTLLRGDLRYDGVVITDDLEMGAIIKNYGIGEACKMAVLAGADMLAICADPDRIREGHRAVLRAVNDGEITADRLQVTLDRIAVLKESLSQPFKFDQQRLGQLSEEIAVLSSGSGPMI